MGRLPVAAILVALAACENPAERLYTDAETAALEKRVLDEVAQIDRSCVRPELVELTNTKCPCADGAPGCVDGLVAQFRAIAAAGVGCSPFQVGVGPDNDWFNTTCGSWAIHVANLLDRHALAAHDSATALFEILDAIRVSQDLARGPVHGMRTTWMMTMEGKLLHTALALVTKAPFSAEQLAVITAKVDALFETEPPILDTLRGESLATALHAGAGAIEGPFWVPPGGPSSLFPPRFYLAAHPLDVGAVMISNHVSLEAKLTQACSNNVTACMAAMMAPDWSQSADVEAEVAHAETLLAFVSSEARLHIQRSVVAKTNSAGVSTLLVGQRARLLSALAALRMQLDTLQTGKCPAPLAPRPLGGPVQIKRVGDGIDVLPPLLVAQRRAVAHISCP